MIYFLRHAEQPFANVLNGVASEKRGLFRVVSRHYVSPHKSLHDLHRPPTPGQDRLRKFPTPGSDVPGFLGGVPVGGW